MGGREPFVEDRPGPFEPPRKATDQQQRGSSHGKRASAGCQRARQAELAGAAVSCAWLPDRVENRLGRIGLWAPLRLWTNAGPAARDIAAELEGLGIEAIWLGNGPDALDTVGELLQATRTVHVATGVLNVWAHSADATAGHYLTLRRQHPGRTLLGLGSGWRPDSPDAPSPYTKIVRYMDDLEIAEVPCEERILAALGPRMLELAARRSTGAHPFLTTPDHTHRAREILGHGPLLAPEQMVVIETDEHTARAVARNALEFYLTKPNYAASLRRQGFSDGDLAAGGSDRLVDALVAWGSLDTVLARVDQHRQAGADHVAIQVLTPDTHGVPAHLRRLPHIEYRELAAAITQ
ncbi:MAG TPA: LLM class F420-dependent oxidoreductase [Jatrophihabitantaceae bacterium]